MALETLEKCPICNHTVFATLLVCQDFLTSHEHFELKTCVSCTFVFTSPRPDSQSLPAYYESKNYISHTGKSSGVINFLYLLARKFTLRWKINRINLFKKNISILDYGCGTGELLLACQHQGWQVAGLEPNTHARQKATQKTGINIAGNLNQFVGQQFDVITLWHVLEHVMDLRKKLSELKGLLKNDGLLFLAVPNCQSPDALFYQEYWAGYDVPRHLWHFTKATMNALLTSEGLTVRSIHPMKLDAYYVSLLSEKYKSSNRITPATFIQGAVRGFLSNRKAHSTANHSSLLYIVAK
jgi:2-polyprenyl-3-methyl-5-hydroxy-6-metoxy-1,4-benzoquinol methylase